jgi:lipopolysaccharide biosynthesis glycosyltransferase/glycosyltransferase involved in cell wall biosynthesis
MGKMLSVVIPFYNGLTYIDECVGSVLGQGIDGIEVIVVDDRDPGHTGDSLDELFAGEERVRVVHRERNGGTLRARRDGVLASKGKFVMLMDQDDSLADGCLEGALAEAEAKPVDILHFGVDVVAETPEAEAAREGMQSFLTPPVRELSGKDILAYQFAEEGGFDWQVHHKVYNGDFARGCWALAADELLMQADDLYMSFILASKAKTYRSVPDRWYVYHLGRGDTLGSSYEFSDFERICKFDAKVYGRCRIFVESGADGVSRDDFGEILGNVRRKLASHAMNEMYDNLAASEYDAAIDYALGCWDASAVATELMRFSRDEAYAALMSEKPVDENSWCFRFYNRAEILAAQDCLETEDDFEEMRESARGHLFDLERINGFAASSDADAPTLSKRSAYEAEDLRIFVTTHKNVDIFHSNVLQPVQVGARSPRRRLLWAYQDDTGNNIAAQNAMYCELTTQYWAWKNADAKYYGFCHYRRYFDFSEEEHRENDYGEVMDGPICWGTQALYKLDDDSMRAAVEGYDVVTTGIKDLRDFPEKYQSPYDHYSRAPYLKIADLDRTVQILKEMHPDYAEDADAYLAGHLTCFCNMYIMRKELFFRYCEWMFPILEKFVADWDTSLLSHETLRTPGHLSERLFNIWLTHEKRVNPELKHKQLQCVHFEQPEHTSDPRLEAADGHGKPVVPVVFAADINYVPMVTTTIYSMLVNASKECFYDVYILEKDIGPYYGRLLDDFFSGFENANVRCVNVNGYVGKYNLHTSNEHISVETYYRFLIQKILPSYDKVIYLDSDLIVNGDVSELFSVDLGDNLIAAARDIDYLGNLNMNDGARMKYTREVLELVEPYDYFQAGVLVLNTAEMRKLYPFQKWLEIAAEPKYIYDDQDILNAHCQGRVTYLDNEWNVMNDCCGRIANVFSHAPAAVYDAFMAAYKRPKILHYAGFQKPWKPGPCDLGEFFWMYARNTPFYERLLGMHHMNRLEAQDRENAVYREMDRREGELRRELDRKLDAEVPGRLMSESNVARGVVDVLLPQGSQRRETVKFAVRKLRGK